MANYKCLSAGTSNTGLKYLKRNFKYYTVSSSGDLGACKSNDRSNAKAFFLSVFPGIHHILPRFVRFQSSFGAKKSCTCTVQIVIAYSCFLVKREQLPRHGNLAVEPRQHVASPKKIILRKKVTN